MKDATYNKLVLGGSFIASIIIVVLINIMLANTIWE
jgi:hypothetical protein